MLRVLLIMTLAVVCVASDPAPAPRADDRVAKLIEQLGAPEFKARESAQRELRTLGEKAEAALRAGLQSGNPEVRQRCRKVLAEIRKDTHAALVKVFDPAKEEWPDHPLWRRFERIAGDTAASRDVFVRVIENFGWYCTLDEAERNPATTATAYREEMFNIGRWDIDDPRTQFPLWERLEGGAYLSFLGSYPATLRARPDGPDRELYDYGEHRFGFSLGLQCGLTGEQPGYG